jgi:hypothetical protein
MNSFHLLRVAALATCAQFICYGLNINVALNSEDFMLLENDHTLMGTTQDTAANFPAILLVSVLFFQS